MTSGSCCLAFKGRLNIINMNKKIPPDLIGMVQIYIENNNAAAVINLIAAMSLDLSYLLQKEPAEIFSNYT